MIIAIAIFFAYICAKVTSSAILNKEMVANLNRLNALVDLGKYLQNYHEENPAYNALQKTLQKAVNANGWFTPENIKIALHDWGQTLNHEALSKWIDPYNFTTPKKPKRIALILAGNIPLVGFHDLICVWLSGHHAIVKCASKDAYLLPFLTDFLEQKTNEKCFTYTQELITGFEAVIATGSNNAGRYFEHYFGNYPHIIRKNRNGVAVLDGTESIEDLQGLGKDMLQYFGLGCRNVSKLYLPTDFDINKIFEGVYPQSSVIHHAKYANNYDYNKAVYLMSEFDFLENGFLMLREQQSFSAPIACVHYEYYNHLEELKKELIVSKKNIQCVVSNSALPQAVRFGKAQQPKLYEYADGINTLSFLENLYLEC
jgi:hypothetical protein